MRAHRKEEEEEEEEEEDAARKRDRRHQVGIMECRFNDVSSRPCSSLAVLALL